MGLGNNQVIAGLLDLGVCPGEAALVDTPLPSALFGQGIAGAIVMNSEDGQRHIFSSSAFHRDNCIGETRRAVGETVR